ncbi:hypothetical protein [Rathayibacter sp. AY1F3]|uniref:hypothetical protein n=1 Tax=Rathayibacter sp. AY1F3 TaxID=2080558 RepID=UPI0011B05647|nr:hypothetical protein [Rathayibacter sp. AY1F3]
MSTDLDVQPFEDAMWAAVSELARRRAQIQVLEDELKETRNDVDTAIQRYAAALSIEGRPVSRETVRALYWEHSDVRADTIARAFAIKGGAGQVHHYAGVDHVDVPCPDGCGASVRLTSRTAAVKPCASCTARTKERHEGEWEAVRREQQQRRVERDAWIRSELVKGRSSGDLYAELVGKYETNGPLPMLRQLEEEIRGAAHSSK